MAFLRSKDLNNELAKVRVLTESEEVAPDQFKKGMLTTLSLIAKLLRDIRANQTLMMRKDGLGDEMDERTTPGNTNVPEGMETNLKK